MEASLPDLVQKARTQLADLTGLELGTTVSIARAEKGWALQVEVVEKRSIPDSQDILATYELSVDGGGHVHGVQRIGMRKRMDVEAGAAANGEI